MTDNRNDQYMSVKISPEIPSRLIKETLEGNILWGLFKVDPTTSDASQGILLSSENIVKWGRLYIGGVFGKLENWIELAEASNCKFGELMLEQIQDAMADIGPEGVMQVELAKPGSENPLTLPFMLQGLLQQYSDELDTAYFTMHITQGNQYDDPMSLVSFITREDIQTLDTDEWLKEKMLLSNPKNTQFRHP